MCDRRGGGKRENVLRHFPIIFCRIRAAEFGFGPDKPCFALAGDGFSDGDANGETKGGYPGAVSWVLRDGMRGG